MVARFPLPSIASLQDPATIPIKDEEAREQARLVAALRRCWVDLPDHLHPCIFHVPNGGSRNKVEGYNLKIQGVLAGVMDLVIVAPQGLTVFIEMKAHDGRESTSQIELRKWFKALDHHVIIAYSAEEALRSLSALFNTNGELSENIQAGTR